MCGIIGAIHTRALPANVDKFLKNALVVDAVRGAHSTGACILSKTGDKLFYDIRKEAVCGGEFVETTYDPTKENSNVYAVIGHNRYATVGGITKATAHPFKVGNVIGVHNGTLTGDWRKKLDCGKKIEVDSNGLMHSLMYRGANKTFSSVSGAAAVVWTDILHNRTFVYRNSQRPLHYAHTTGGVLIYGSEKLMLEWLIDRNNITVTPAGVQSFDTDTVYEITGGEVKELDKVEMFREPVTYSENWGDYYGRGYYSRFQRDTSSSASECTNVTSGPDDNDYGITNFNLEDVLEQQFAEYQEELELYSAHDKGNCSPTVVGTKTEVRKTNGTGLTAVLGGLDMPSLREMYGSTVEEMRQDNASLPIAVPLHMSDSRLREIGYERQNGVWFRRAKVTPFERKHGVICEFAERLPTTYPVCDYDGESMYSEYLESIALTDTERKLEPVTVACENLASWRHALSDYETKFRKILFVNIVNKFDVPETA